MGHRVLRRSEVERKVGFKRSALYKLIAEGAFPKQIKLGPRSSGWLESEVEAWIENRIAIRDKTITPPPRRIK